MGVKDAPRPTVYGPWDYTAVREPFAYDDTPTYALAAAWVTLNAWRDGNDPGIVEDWGCGTAWMRNYIPPAWTYRGVDGAWSRFADVQADLRTYTSNVPCAVMRHVLEHNADWRTIARNFTDSWHERAALVMFIPPSADGDFYVSDDTWPVPDISVDGDDLFDILSDHGTVFDFVDIHYPTTASIQYSWEGVVLMSR